MKHDACTVLAGVRAAERDTTATLEARLELIRKAVVPLPDGPEVLGTRDEGIRFASMETVTPECRAELDPDTFVPGVFGQNLLHNSWDATGRIAGDIIYAQDLTDHNEVLRKRFAGRSWYRLEVSESRDGVLSARVVPY